MRGTVVNTPGYYYAISYWLSALVMILVHGRGKRDLWKYLYGVLSFIIIFTISFFYRWNKADVLHAFYDMRVFIAVVVYQDGRRASVA